MTLAPQPLPPSASDDTVRLLHRVVRRVDGPRLAVADPDTGRLTEARRAKGCLVAPEEGDLVLVADGPAGTHILSVLDSAAPATRLTPVAEAGTLHLHAPGGLLLDSDGEVRTRAVRVSLAAAQGEAEVEHMVWRGQWLEGRIGRLKVVAETLETMAGTVISELARAVRRVAGLDQTRAGVLDMAAEETATLHGRHTIVTADKDIKVDGDQIHMG